MRKVTQKTEMNKTRDQKFKVYCSQCKRETNHSVVESAYYSGSEEVKFLESEDSLVTLDWSNNYQIIQCQGCDFISFRHISDNDWNGRAIWLYPKRSDKSRLIREYYNVNTTLQQIYRETIECFNNDMLTLCAAGLRAIIEGICADQQVMDGPVEVTKAGGEIKIERRKNIEGKIAGLGEKGILTKEHATTLHEHRFLGNKAMHQLDRPSLDELILAIDIIEHTLDALYEMPDKADQLRRIKAKRIDEQNKPPWLD